MRVVLDSAAPRRGRYTTRFRCEANSHTPTWDCTRAVPGNVQAEEFDRGTSVAHYDLTPGNRADCIDRPTPTSHASDIGGALLSAGRGGRVAAYVRVRNGTYHSKTRVANIGTGGKFHRRGGRRGAQADCRLTAVGGDGEDDHDSGHPAQGRHA